MLFVRLRLIEFIFDSRHHQVTKLRQDATSTQTQFPLKANTATTDCSKVTRGRRSSRQTSCVVVVVHSLIQLPSRRRHVLRCVHKIELTSRTWSWLEVHSGVATSSSQDHQAVHSSHRILFSPTNLSTLSWCNKYYFGNVRLFTQLSTKIVLVINKDKKFSKADRPARQICINLYVARLVPCPSSFAYF